jgi:hypothetical protein
MNPNDLGQTMVGARPAVRLTPGSRIAVTLIASVITHAYAVQVSHRRVTRGPNTAPEVISDIQPKTTVTLGGALLG